MQHWASLSNDGPFSGAKKRLARRWLTAVVYWCGFDHSGGKMALSRRQNDAGANGRSTGFEGLVRELSSVAPVTRGDETAGLAELKSEIAGIIQKNYGQALRQCLSRWEVREIANEGKNRVWPGLN